MHKDILRWNYTRITVIAANVANTYFLSEIIELVGGGTPKTTVTEYWNGNIPWLSVADFAGEIKCIYTTEKTITHEGLKNSSTRLLDKSDIIISARGTVGELGAGQTH